VKRSDLPIVAIVLLFLTAGVGIAHEDPIPIWADTAFHIRYASNLAIGDSVINFTVPVMIQDPETPDIPPDPTTITPSDIKMVSISATGDAAFQIRYASNLLIGPSIVCLGSCFTASPTGISMGTDQSITITDMQGPELEPVMTLTPTGEGSTLIRGTWSNAQNPDVVATGVGRFTVVPEPSTFALMTLGVAGIGFARRRARE
jgi:hypothetical protein